MAAENFTWTESLIIKQKISTCNANLAIAGYTWSGGSTRAYWEVQFPVRKCTREKSVRVRLKHETESPLSSFAQKGKPGTRARWKLQFAPTGALVIPGIQNMPLHVAADKSRCNAVALMLSHNAIRKQKNVLLASYWRDRRSMTCGIPPWFA